MDRFLSARSHRSARGLVPRPGSSGCWWQSRNAAGANRRPDALLQEPGDIHDQHTLRVAQMLREDSTRSCDLGLAASLRRYWEPADVAASAGTGGCPGFDYEGDPTLHTTDQNQHCRAARGSGARLSPSALPYEASNLSSDQNSLTSASSSIHTASATVSTRLLPKVSRVRSQPTTVRFGDCVGPDLVPSSSCGVASVIQEPV
jgi:hypothetical protein